MIRMNSLVVKFTKFYQAQASWISLIVILIFIYFVSFRFMIIKVDQAVHYHADFGVYINGQAQAFDHFSYYEELSACNKAHFNQPSSRVHLHQPNNHIIHVHDQAVTYGHFFTNLGWYLSNRILQTESDIYQDNQQGQLRFILNGQLVTHITNRVIDSEDVLLVDFSNDDQSVLQQRYQDLPRGASQANQTQDPANCSGEGSQNQSIWHRLWQALGF
ncbi:MAG: hypothetical protein OXF49_03315 [Candidatus Saccharibacteria bacterium]|nr:hypothetical protein [Candidatus Saccharibacteria bacterium]